MNFLFSSTINLAGGQDCVYKVYKYKLVPSEYRAELVEGTCIPLIVFWKENSHWRTIRKTREVKQIAAILGHEIAKSKN